MTTEFFGVYSENNQGFLWNKFALAQWSDEPEPSCTAISCLLTFYHYPIKTGNAVQERKLMTDRYILAIESSCDETSVAILKNERELLTNIIASQVESHKRFGGVVPEVASRHHVEVITTCIDQALTEANLTASDLTAVAVTHGPGLVGALLVGMAAAKAFAWAHGLPVIPVNHMAGHLMAANEQSSLTYPLLALLVSGGHTELVYVPAAGQYQIIGETRDDAVGEAYDKVGRVMGLTYPAGREIDDLAHQGQDTYHFPRAMIREDNLDFSFSGLKSAFINLHHNAQQKGETLVLEDLCASFQAAVLDILISKTKKALERYPVDTLVVAGGVAANKGLRERLAQDITDTQVIIPPLRLCGDNAGMIALAAAVEYDQGHFADLSLNAQPSLVLGTWESSLTD